MLSERSFAPKTFRQDARVDVLFKELWDDMKQRRVSRGENYFLLSRWIFYEDWRVMFYVNGECERGGKSISSHKSCRSCEVNSTIKSTYLCTLPSSVILSLKLELIFSAQKWFFFGFKSFPYVENLISIRHLLKVVNYSLLNRDVKYNHKSRKTQKRRVYDFRKEENPSRC